MLKDLMIEKVVEEFHGSILAAPKRQRRLRSSTFWNKFGFERRTKERIESVKNVLREKSIILNENNDFGSERKNDWIVLTYVEADYLPVIEKVKMIVSEIFTPTNEWFGLMKNRRFKSEREVEYYFILPLLEQLGYQENDFAIGHPVSIYIGSKRINTEADIVVFDGVNHSQKTSLLVVEAKKSGKILTKDHIGQVDSYATELSTPYYILTNGDEVRVYLSLAKIQPAVELLNFKQDNLKENWSELYKTLSKKAITKQKEKLKKLLELNGF